MLSFIASREHCLSRESSTGIHMCRSYLTERADNPPVAKVSARKTRVDRAVSR